MSGPSQLEVKRRQGARVTWEDYSTRELKLEVARMERVLDHIHGIIERRKREASQSPASND